MSEKTYRVAHILVPARYEAEDILRKLKEGADFGELAKRYSNCTSAANKGDLGEVKTGRADRDFEEAVFNLKIGEVTASPIRTKHGYHLIKRIT